MTGEMRVSLFFLFVLILIWTTLASVGVEPVGLLSYLSNLVLYLAAWFFLKPRRRCGACTGTARTVRCATSAMAHSAPPIVGKSGNRCRYWSRS